MNFKTRIKFNIAKILRFEYWPYQVFYFPMFLYGLYLGLKAKSFTYYTTTNPAMKYGGIMGESKFKVLSMIPELYRPKTLFFSKEDTFSAVKSVLNDEFLPYPFIAKPDVGERGFNVELIKSENELLKYYERSKMDFILQEFVEYSLELGVLYHKIPGSRKGKITSLVKKAFLEINGDGKSTLRELLNSEIRAIGRLEYLEKKFQDRIDNIVGKNEKILLEPIGNHCRGTTFLDGNHLINEQLNDVFDDISKSIPGFFYGRFDLKVPDLESLYSGINIKILELNGVSSEPAHIYDPSYKLLHAYRDVKKHMDIIYKIAEINHRQGLKHAPLSQFIKDARTHLHRQKQMSF